MADTTNKNKDIPASFRPRKVAKVQLGLPARLNDAELDDLAKISPADVIAAKALWNEYAPAPLKGLLDAEPEE
jgi:hypothetical protein